MKNNRTLILCAVSIICLTTSSLRAQTSAKKTFIAENIKLEVPSTGALTIRVINDQDPQKFILSIDNPQAEKLKISVEGVDGIIYRSQLHSSFAKRFDMSGTEDGEYTIIINASGKTYREVIYLNTKPDASRHIVKR